MVPTTIAATDVSVEVSGDSVQRGYQRAAFFALGRHWVFYIREGVIPVLVFESSVGASGVWSGETAFGVALTDGAEFSLTLQETSPTTAFVHLAWADATGANPLNYVRGTLAAAGTIAWDGVQTVVALEIGFEYENPGICINFGPAPQLYIVYNRVSIADPTICTPYFTMSTTVNGTWTTGAGYPTQVTAVEDPSWVPLVAPYGAEVIVVYAADSGSIYSRLLNAGIFEAEVDSGVLIGVDAGKISIAAERQLTGGSFNGRAIYVAYQAADWDLYCLTYSGGAWAGAAVSIQSIGAFRQANPLLTIMNYGDEDATVADHSYSTLYCFWTPTTDIPTAEYVTYRLSRDQNTTWTNEAGADAAVSWIDETGDGFEVQQSGSVYAFNSEDYVSDLARSYIGIVYVTHTMPATLRHAALAFADPDEDLACAFVVRQPGADTNLHGELIVRHNSPTDVGAPDLLAGFSVTLLDQNLAAEFVVRGAGSQNLLAGFESLWPFQDLAAEFVPRRAALLNLGAGLFVGVDANEELLGEFVVRQITSENLAAAFVVRDITSENLLGELVVVQGPVDVELLGGFIVRHPGSQDLAAGFIIERDEFVSQGVNVTVYQALGIIS